jgi:Flp pilus assembly protein TadD
MQQLGFPDAHRLSAAVGWLELGNPFEGLAELDQVNDWNRQHPEVLEARWALHAAAGSWVFALDAARALVRADPDRASGWLHQAYALRRAPNGGLEKAWEALRPAWDRFPLEPTIAYNLSCYACQLNKVDEARNWLKRAAQVGGLEHIKRMALTDADLRPLWPEIAEL